VRSRPSKRRRPVTPHATREEAELLCPRVGRFQMRAGHEIEIRPELGADAALLRLYLLGPALAVLLRQRGFLVLHASAAEVGGAAVAFLGASGSGKSTLAAALVARGHRLVADDYVAIEPGPHGVMLTPGIPQLKLWPDAAAAVGAAAHTLKRLYSGVEKRSVPAGEKFATAPRQLRGAYVLCEGEAPAIQRLNPQESLVELLRHSYGPRTLAAIRTREHFRQCAQVVSAVPATRLCVPRALAALPDVCRLIEEEA
jgi:HPr serine kinase-like protein